MLIDQSMNQFFITDFNKRFENFCKKAPVMLSFKVNDSGVYVHECSSNEVKKFNFDYNKSVKANIREIRNWLIEYKYPILIQTKIIEKDYSTEEYREMISEGKITLDDIPFTKKIVEDSIRWRIERLIVKRDEFFVRNLETNEIFRYKLHMSSILFLKRLREEKLNSFEGWDLFNKKSILLNKIEEEIEDDKEF